MALIQIPNQPIVLNPQEDCPDCDPRCFCQKYSGDDKLYWQGKQSVCGESIVCDEDFSEIVLEYAEEPSAVNLVNNGTFTGNAGGWALSWGFAYDTNNIKNTPNVHLSVARQPLLFQIGHKYQINYTVSGRTAGSAKCGIGVSPNNSMFGIVRTADGVYSEDFIRTNEGGDPHLFITCSADFDGYIDDVEVYEYPLVPTSGDCWSIDVSEGAVPTVTLKDGGGICHTPEDNFVSLRQTGILETNELYKVQVRISNYAGGAILVEVGGNVLTTYPDTANGVFTLWGESFGADLVVTLLEAFDGCVDWVRCYKLNNNYEAAILNADDDSFVVDITDSISYYQDWITIIQDLSELGLDNNSCYKLALYGDCCNEPDIELICNGDFALAEDEEGGCWEHTISGNADVTINPNLAEACDIFFNDNNPAIVTIFQPVSICQNRRYAISFDYDSSIDFQWQAYIASEANGVIFLTGFNGVSAGMDTITDEISTCNIPTWYDDLTLRIAINNGAGDTGNIRIDNVSLKMTALDTEVDCPEFISNCFCWKEGNDCLERVMMGYADSAAYGFEFYNTNFRLQVRTLFSLDKPSYDSEENSYIYSDGKRELSFSQNEKFQTLFINQVDATTHDTISVMRLLKHFYLGDKNNVLTEYIAKKGDYAPEWVKDEYLKLAPSRFDVSKKGSIGFMTNC